MKYEVAAFQFEDIGSLEKYLNNQAQNHFQLVQVVRMERSLLVITRNGNE